MQGLGIKPGDSRDSQVKDPTHRETREKVRTVILKGPSHETNIIISALAACVLMGFKICGIKKFIVVIFEYKLFVYISMKLPGNYKGKRPLTPLRLFNSWKRYLRKKIAQDLAVKLIRKCQHTFTVITLSSMITLKSYYVAGW